MTLPGCAAFTVIIAFLSSAPHSPADAPNFGPFAVAAPGGGNFVVEQIVFSALPEVRITNKTGRNWGGLRLLLTVTGRLTETAKPITKQANLDISAIYIDETQEFAVDLDLPEMTVSTVKVAYGTGYRQPNEEEKEQEGRKAAAAAAARAAALAKKPKLDSGAAAVPVAADRKCLDQTMAALGVEGLESRKRIAELVKYGCIFTVPRLTPIDVLKADGRYSLVGVAAGGSAGKQGWVATDWIKGGTPASPKPEKKTVI